MTDEQKIQLSATDDNKTQENQVEKQQKAPAPEDKESTAPATTQQEESPISTNVYDFSPDMQSEYEKWKEELSNKEIQLKKQFLEEKKQGKPQDHTDSRYQNTSNTHSALPFSPKEFMDYYKKTIQKEEEKEKENERLKHTNMKGKEKYGITPYKNALHNLNGELTKSEYELIKDSSYLEDMIFKLGSDESLLLQFQKANKLQKAKIIASLEEQIQQKEKPTQNNTNKNNLTEEYNQDKQYIHDDSIVSKSEMEKIMQEQKDNN